MEHFFTGVICLIFFLAHLQARPITDDLNLDHLLSDVSCGNNVTFTSPTNVQNHCCTAAYKCIMDQLEKARINCTDKNNAIDSTLETLEVYSTEMCPQSVHTNTSDCKWGNPKSQKPLVNFVADIKGFVQYLNTPK